MTTLLGLTGFTLLTGARSCSGGVGYGAGTAYEEYYYEEPVVVGGGYVGGGYVDSPVIPVVDILGDLALTVYQPYDDGLTPFTESFSVTVREDSAYGPVIVEGDGFVFDLSGAGAVDLTDLPYGLYDIELVGYDLYGATVSYAATTVTVDEPIQYFTLELQNSGDVPGPVVVDVPVPVEVVGVGDVVLDLQAPDGGAYSGQVDTIDYYLWQWDEFTGEYVFIESIGYVPVDLYDPPVIPDLDLGYYYLEVDSFDYAGYKNYLYAGEFEHAGSVTSLTVWLDYAE